MVFQLDHVVHVVRDSDQAAASLRELGLHVVSGGEHPNWGTHNALAYFDTLTYSELIAIQEPAVAAASDFGALILRFLEQGEGVGTVALRTTDIEGDVARLRARGIALADAKEGSRRLPDGSLLTWKLALAPWPLPFLIEWGAPVAVRKADLAGRGALNPPGRRVERVLWAVSDRHAGWLTEGYGIPVGQPYDDPALAALCVDSEVCITLCTPTGPGPVKDRLERRGEGPLGYVVTGIGLIR